MAEKTKNGVGASGWAYTPDKEKTSTWKLNISTAAHASAAVAALGEGFRGNKVDIPSEDLAAVKKKVASAYKKFYPDKELPEILKASFSEKLTTAITNLTKLFGPSEEVKESVQIAKAEEMVSYEVVYEPNVKDAHGEWMSTETVQKACEDFNKNLAEGIVQPNLFHAQNTDTFTIEKSWIVPEMDMVVEATGEKVKAGTWVAKIKYNDNNLWTLKKAGVIGGVSIGAIGSVNKETGEITNVSFASKDIQKAMMQQTSGGTSDPSHMMSVANLSNTGVAPKKSKRKRLVYAP